MPESFPDRPKIFLVVILPMMGVGGVLVVELLIRCFTFMRGLPRRGVPNINGLLIGLPAIVLWIPISLLLANLVVYAVPYFRQLAEQYVTAAHKPGFRECQRYLLRAAGYMAAVCVPLIALGFWL